MILRNNSKFLFNVFFFIQCIYFIFSQNPAVASEDGQTEQAGLNQAILQSYSNPQEIKNLEISIHPYEVHYLDELNETRPFIELQGKYTGDLPLTINSIKIGNSRNGDFSVQVPISGRTTPVIISADIPDPKPTMILYIIYSSWGMEESRPLRWTKWGLGIEGSSITYSESGLPNFSQIGLGIKSDFSYLVMPKYLEAGLSVRFVGLPIVTNTNQTMSLLGASVKLEYIPNLLSEPFDLRLIVGWYYTTTFVTDNAFGYANITGIMLYPTLKWLLKNNRSLGTYLKYSPVASIFSTTSFEAGTGLSYSWPVSKTKTMSVNFDFSFLTLRPIPQAQLTNRIYSLGLGINW